MPSTPSTRTRLASPVVVLAVLGLVLLPGPLYAMGFDALDGPDRTRSPTGYVAPEFDGTNDTEVASRYGDHVSLQVDDLRFDHVADDFRAPNETREVLESAIADGAVVTQSDAVVADVRRVDREYPFVTREYDTYYRVTVDSDAGPERPQDAAMVEATPVNDSAVAAEVRRRVVVHWEDLTPAQRETFRAVRNATTSDDQFAYRPWSDEPMPGKPIVERDGQYYAVRGVMHVDDFGPSRGVFLGFAASLAGLACLGLAGLVWGYRRYRGG